MKQKGYFITFEGADGSGKTSILNRVFQTLKAEKINLEITREPGGKDLICEEIRKLVLGEFGHINKYTEALLFAASRSQHVNDYIIPKLNEGVHIICDRFLDSSIVFQGYGREIGGEKVEAINRFGIGDFNPDYTFFFQIESEESIKRILNNPQREVNRLDLEKKDFLDKIDDGYKKLIENHSKRIIMINANLSFDEVYEEVLIKLRNILKG
ncbi:MAG: dTMP kinase [Mycoplasmoidaceae bacterium]